MGGPAITSGTGSVVGFTDFSVVGEALVFGVGIVDFGVVGFDVKRQHLGPHIIWHSTIGGC